MQEGGKPSPIARACGAPQPGEVSVVRIQEKPGVVDCLDSLHGATLKSGNTFVRQGHEVKRHTTDRRLKAGWVGWRDTQASHSERGPFHVDLKAKLLQGSKGTLSLLDGEGSRRDGV